MTATPVCLFFRDLHSAKEAMPPSCRQIPCAPFFDTAVFLMTAFAPDWMRKPSCLLFLMVESTTVMLDRPAVAIPCVPFLEATHCENSISAFKPLAIAPHCLLESSWQSFSDARPLSSAPTPFPPARIIARP